MTATKPTPEQIEHVRFIAHRGSGLLMREQASLQAVLDAYEASLRPIEPSADAPLSVPELPDYWDRRRECLGKDKSTCAAELRRALEHRAAPSGSLRAVAEEVIAIAQDCRVYSSSRDASDGRVRWLAPKLAAEVIRLEAKALAFDRIDAVFQKWKGTLNNSAWHVCLEIKDIVEDVTHEWVLSKQEDSPDGR